MAFDGITVAAVVKELNDKLSGGRIYKIAQPEADEMIFTVKTAQGQQRLFLSADASLPLVYLTDSNKQGPMTAPNFCMLLRKHLQNARILGFSQPGLERVIRMELEHYNELGDLCRKTLVAEIMGKHSNLILVDENEMIVDSIKRISGLVSSVREVLPGKAYFIAQTVKKEDPLLAVREDFLGGICLGGGECLEAGTDRECGVQAGAAPDGAGESPKQKNQPVYKALYTYYTGLSPFVSHGICAEAGVEPEKDVRSLDAAEAARLWEAFSQIMFYVKAGKFKPQLYYESGKPAEFSAVPLQGYSDARDFESISALLNAYYAEKNLLVRIRQRSGDLRKIVQNAMERTAKKYDLQLEQLKDTEKREKYRVYGELINAYGYGVEEGAKKMEALNYYTGEMVTIPLDETMSASENAKKYFEKYGKLKRTKEALGKLTQETGAQLRHLESILTSLNIAQKEEDLVQIKEELIECGYMKRKGGQKKQKVTSRPFHYISSDGFHIYVGKNNYQNDELTFKMAGNKDWWFHAKNLPGSHVVVKTEGAKLPDRTFEEAAALAAYYSRAGEQDKVEVDYLERRNVKKPNGAAPGFVVYYTNYSMVVAPSRQGLTQVE